MRRRRRTRQSLPTLFKLCSLLLQYPDDELISARPDLLATVEELPPSDAAAVLRRFAAWWGGEDPLALQQHYVETFDLDKRCGLYLTYYREGDRRQRGTVLLRLKRLYRSAGLPLEGCELPDYLPVMLEFAAAAPEGRGRLVLGEHRAALELLAHSLRDRGTPYADVVEAASLAVGEPSGVERARALQLAAAGPPSELVGLEPSVPPEIMPVTSEATQ